MSLLPASIKRIGSKTTEKRWRHRFSHYKSVAAFCCHGNQSFDPICPKTLCSLSPTPVMLHIKSDQDWPTGFRDTLYSSLKCGQDFMHVLVTVPASIKGIESKTTKKRWRHHFPYYKSMGDFCCHGNQSFDPICPKTLCSLSPTPVMLHIKFDQDWPTGFRDIHV